jgi:hypothetical protein
MEAESAIGYSLLYGSSSGTPSGFVRRSAGTVGTSGRDPVVGVAAAGG